MTYIVFKLNLNGTLSNKENLDSIDEVNTWIYEKKYASCVIFKSDYSKCRVMTDNGEFYETVYEGDWSKYGK